MIMFDTLNDDELSSTHGGVDMRLTQYGYPNDPYTDSNTRAGRGAYRNLERGESMAITDSGLAALGLTRQDVRRNEHWVDIRRRGGGGILTTRRIDDRAPQRDMRADLYNPGGFDRSMPDYADVTLRR
jgi:hypothetical protein